MVCPDPVSSTYIGSVCKELKPELLKDQSQLNGEGFEDQRRDFIIFLRKKANRE